MRRDKPASPTTRRLKQLAISKLARVRARIQQLEDALETEENEERRRKLEDELIELERPFEEGEMEPRPPSH